MKEDAIDTQVSSSSSCKNKTKNKRTASPTYVS